MKNIEPYKISSALSSLLVNIESQMKSDPEISLKDFCSNQRINPTHLLHTIGFQSLITISALVPLKEVLDKNDAPSNWDNLRKARNSLCHGRYSFNTDGAIVFKDGGQEFTLTPKEIVELSNQAYDAYNKKTS